MPTATLAKTEPALTRTVPKPAAEQEHVWKLRIYRLEPDGRGGTGVGIATGGEHSAAGELRSVRIRFRLTEAEYRQVLGQLNSQLVSQPIWDVRNSAVIGFEYAPPGLGWSGVRF